MEERSASADSRTGQRQRPDIVPVGAQGGGDLVHAQAPSQKPGTRTNRCAVHAPKPRDSHRRSVVRGPRDGADGSPEDELRLARSHCPSSVPGARCNLRCAPSRARKIAAASQTLASSPKHSHSSASASATTQRERHSVLPERMELLGGILGGRVSAAAGFGVGVGVHRVQAAPALARATGRTCRLRPWARCLRQTRQRDRRGAERRAEAGRVHSPALHARVARWRSGELRRVAVSSPAGQGRQPQQRQNGCPAGSA